MSSIFSSVKEVITTTMNAGVQAVNTSSKLIDMVDNLADIGVATSQYAKDANTIWIYQGKSELSEAECNILGVDYTPPIVTSTELTSAQKAAITRAANKAAKEQAA